MSEYIFCIGDVITGKEGSRRIYNCTNEYATMEVLGVEGENITVKVLSSTASGAKAIGHIFMVRAEYFVLVNQENMDKRMEARKLIKELVKPSKYCRSKLFNSTDEAVGRVRSVHTDAKGVITYSITILFSKNKYAVNRTVAVSTRSVTPYDFEKEYPQDESLKPDDIFISEISGALYRAVKVVKTKETAFSSEVFAVPVGKNCFLGCEFPLFECKKIEGGFNSFWLKAVLSIGKKTIVERFKTIPDSFAKTEIKKCMDVLGYSEV